MRAKLKAIVAVGPNGEIGYRGALPWPRLQKDMAHFARETAGKPVIMGRRTWDSLPKRPLDGRWNIVVTRYWATVHRSLKQRFDADCMRNISVCSSLDDVMFDTLREDWFREMYPEAMVIGGRSIYEQSMPQLDEIVVTEVKPPEGTEIKADCYFPGWPLDPAEWAELLRPSRWFVDQPSGYSLRFRTFTRKED